MYSIYFVIRVIFISAKFVADQMLFYFVIRVIFISAKLVADQMLFLDNDFNFLCSSTNPFIWWFTRDIVLFFYLNIECDFSD